jgi:leucyl aminopeptidase
MDALVAATARARASAIECVDEKSLAALKRRLDARQRRWLDASGFRPRPGRIALLPDAEGALERIVVGVRRSDPLWALAALPWQLPAGRYHVENHECDLDGELAALGWALGAYRFARYRKAGRDPAQLLVARSTKTALAPIIEAVGRVRDLVNTPTCDMGPGELAGAVKELGHAHQARVREWVGDALLKNNFPTIHMVGRASHRPPRLVELTWVKTSDPAVTLVGKGVCFDSGGLDLKPAAGMRWMKKDMGGAAHAIALAGLIMQAGLPVRLTLLVPTVENSVAGNAMRPGEVVRTRAGHTVEVHNTDAEGRLILCDALAYASEREPDLIMDFATLTGAARVALGPDLPAVFSNRDDMADELARAATEVHDPIWRLPLWAPYMQMLESSIADFANAGATRHAGAITAALYLKRFIPDALAWVHTDVYAWNDTERPGRPRGGEAQSLRAMFAFLCERYG